MDHRAVRRRIAVLDDSNYTVLEPVQSGGADLIRVDAASGRRSELIPAAKFKPAGAKDVEGYVGRTITGSCSSSPTPRACGVKTRAGTSKCSTSLQDP
jgi:hypothetical protein